MKRSEINKIMENGLSFIEKEMKFLLPPFAKWSPNNWQLKGKESVEIVDQQLGWDITDFGSGKFNEVGLLLFTIRNGSFEELKKLNGKIYAEKVMIVQEEQITPTHFHYQKMEDIINRGGGELVIQLWNSTSDDRLDLKSDVMVSIDSVKVSVSRVENAYQNPRVSVSSAATSPYKNPGKKGAGTTLVGEVSRVNNDHADNHFMKMLGVLPILKKDVEPLHLLYSDHKNFS